MRNYNTLKPRVYKYKMWKYGYHKGLNRFIFEPLQMLLEKEGIELEPYEKWEFLQKWYKEFPQNFKTLQECRMFLSENEEEILEKVKTTIKNIKGE